MVGAGLMVRSLVSVYAGPGYDPSHVLLLRLRPALVAQSPARAKAFQAEVIRNGVARRCCFRQSGVLPAVAWLGPYMRPARVPGQEPVTEKAALQASFNIIGRGTSRR